MAFLEKLQALIFILALGSASTRVSVEARKWTLSHSKRHGGGSMERPSKERMLMIDDTVSSMTAEPSISETAHSSGGDANLDNTQSGFGGFPSGHSSSKDIAYDLAFFSAAPADRISAAIVALLKARDLYYREYAGNVAVHFFLAGNDYDISTENYHLLAASGIEFILLKTPEQARPDSQENVKMRALAQVPELMAYRHIKRSIFIDPDAIVMSIDGIIEQASIVQSVGCVELFPSAAAEAVARARPEVWQAGLRAAEINANSIKETHAPFCSSQVVLFNNQLMADKRWTVWVDSVLDKQWVVEASAADDSEQDKSPQALSDTDIKLWIALSRADITIHTLDAKFAFRLTRYFWEYCQSQIERMDSLEEQVFISSGSDKFANVEIAVFDDLSRPWSKESRNKIKAIQHPSDQSAFKSVLMSAAPHFMWKWWHFIITSREDLPEISEVFPTFPALPNPPDAVYVKRVNMNVCDIEHNWLVGHIPQRDRFVCEAVCSSSMATHS